MLHAVAATLRVSDLQIGIRFLSHVPHSTGELRAALFCLGQSEMTPTRYRDGHTMTSHEQPVLYSVDLRGCTALSDLGPEAVTASFVQRAQGRRRDRGGDPVASFSRRGTDLRADPRGVACRPAHLARDRDGQHRHLFLFGQAEEPRRHRRAGTGIRRGRGVGPGDSPCRWALPAARRTPLGSSSPAWRPASASSACCDCRGRRPISCCPSPGCRRRSPWACSALPRCRLKPRWPAAERTRWRFVLGRFSHTPCPGAPAFSARPAARR